MRRDEATSAHRRRVSLRAEAARLAREMIKSVGGRCEACGWGWSGRPLVQVHHIVPVSVGGGNEDDNLVVLCPNCHAIAHALESRRDGPMTIGRSAMFRLLRLNRHRVLATSEAA